MNGCNTPIRAVRFMATGMALIGGGGNPRGYWVNQLNPAYLLVLGGITDSTGAKPILTTPATSANVATRLRTVGEHGYLSRGRTDSEGLQRTYRRSAAARSRSMIGAVCMHATQLMLSLKVPYPKL